MRTFTGFEAGSAKLPGVVLSQPPPEVTETKPKTGEFSLECAANTWARFLVPGLSRLWAGMWVFSTAENSFESTRVEIYTETGEAASVRLNNKRYSLYIGNVLVASGKTQPKDWHHLQVYVDTGAGVVQTRVDNHQDILYLGVPGKKITSVMLRSHTFGPTFYDDLVLDTEKWPGICYVDGVKMARKWTKVAGSERQEKVEAWDGEGKTPIAVQVVSRINNRNASEGLQFKLVVDDAESGAAEEKPPEETDVVVSTWDKTPKGDHWSAEELQKLEIKQKFI